MCKKKNICVEMMSYLIKTEKKTVSQNNNCATVVVIALRSHKDLFPSFLLTVCEMECVIRRK